MNDPVATITQQLAALSSADQDRVADYVAFLRWQAGRDAAGPAEPAAAVHPWRFNLLEHLTDADVRASRNAAGMEVKAAEATVGEERRPALWQHPPVDGESLVEFHVPIPAGLRDLRLSFSVGVRDGAQAADRLVAFRVRVDGWQVWSRAVWPIHWEDVALPLPLHAGNILRLTLATDGLGEHEFAWAVWGEPLLVGLETGR
jgi:hypothetical protein